MEWISTDVGMPEKRDRDYQVAAICAKKFYEPGTNYSGEGVRTIVQDWNVRRWPDHYSYWTYLPPLPHKSRGDAP